MGAKGDDVSADNSGEGLMRGAMIGAAIGSDPNDRLDLGFYRYQETLITPRHRHYLRPWKDSEHWVEPVVGAEAWVGDLMVGTTDENGVVRFNLPQPKCLVTFKKVGMADTPTVMRGAKT